MPRMFQQPRGIFFELNKCLDAFHGVAEDESRAFNGPKQIADHRKTTACDVLKQNRRTTTFTNTSMNLRRLQIRADFALQANELSVTLQITNTFLKVAVTHENRLRTTLTWIEAKARYHANPWPDASQISALAA
jgi:hypothetical protein